MRKSIEKIAVKVLFVSGAVAQVTLSLQPQDTVGNDALQLNQDLYEGTVEQSGALTVVHASHSLLDTMYGIDLEAIGSETPGREESLAEVEKNLSAVLDKTNYDYNDTAENRMKTVEAIILQISLLQWGGVESFAFHEDHVFNDDNTFAAYLLPVRALEHDSQQILWGNYTEATEPVWKWVQNDDGELVLDIASLSDLGSNAVSSAATSLLTA